ncbi:uncharacterized protein TNCV_374321 [Trichonephila clavipes]|nr:uncharacterized protein TNCV_374321 [Trichonephila clavipes]
MEDISVVKIPAFVLSDHVLWFGMLESIFELAAPKQITDDRTKYNYCVAHLSPDSAMTVRDQLPPNVQSILAGIQPLTAQKASEVADGILEVTPVQVSAVSKYSSANSDDSSESKLLKELKLLRQEVKELRRPRSFSRNHFDSRNRGKSPKTKASNLCWNHNKFATKARKCIQPCSFQENLNGQE